MNKVAIEIGSNTVLEPKFDKRTEVYKWGLTDGDNQLPSILEYLANESVTVKACVSKCIDAILGKGFTDGDRVIGDRRLTINKLHRQVSRELVVQSQAFIHVRYDGKLNPVRSKLEKCERVRVGSSDDNEYSGKYLVTDWGSKRIVKDSIKVLDRFNDDRRVVASQVLASLGIKRGDDDYDLDKEVYDVSKYKGQIMHITKDSSLKYAVSDMMPILEDAETEINSKVFTKNNSAHGFMNSKIVLVGQMEETQESNLKRDLVNMQGAKNASNLLVFQATNKMADLEKQMIVKDLTSNPSDKVLSFSDSKIESQICKAFGVALLMISGKSEGIFGNNGDILGEMKRQLYTSREHDRMVIEEAFRLLFDNKTLSIIDPFKDNTDKDDLDPVAENLKAQATLRGSVGGTTVLMNVLIAYNANQISRGQAMAMISNQYGYSDTEIDKMLPETITAKPEKL